MNENAVFFFPAPEKKKTVLKLNEWMANELFRKQKKKTEKFPEIFWKRQKINLFFFPGFRKKKTRLSDLNEWMANELIRVKKKYDTFAVEQFLFDTKFDRKTTLLRSNICNILYVFQGVFCSYEFDFSAE